MVALAVVGVVVALILGGHTSSSMDGAASSDQMRDNSSTSGTAAGSAPEPAGSQSSSGSDTSIGAPDDGARTLGQPTVISTGSVAVRATDVYEARRVALALVDSLGGTVADEQAETDRRGRLRAVHLTLRVPADRYAASMDRLATLGRLDQRTSTSQDVSTEVIDVAARVRAQRASVDRVEALLARARTIGEVVAVESQLTRRQGELDSLVQRQAFLADQSDLSTIALQVDRLERPAVTEAGGGFLSGLAAGWHALGAVAGGAATALGAVLPFALPGLLLLPLVWWWRRRTSGSAGPAS